MKRLSFLLPTEMNGELTILTLRMVPSLTHQLPWSPSALCGCRNLCTCTCKMPLTQLIFMIEVVSHALTAQESIPLIWNVMSLLVKQEHFTDALEQIVQCHLKAFTDKQWVSDPCRSTGSEEILPFGWRGQITVAEGLVWK